MPAPASSTATGARPTGLRFDPLTTALVLAIHYDSDRVIGLHLGAIADLRRVVGTAEQLQRALPEIAAQRLGGLDTKLGSLRRSLGGRSGRPASAGMAAASANAAIEYANAISLLERAGFPEQIVRDARETARRRLAESAGTGPSRKSAGFGERADGRTREPATSP